MQITWLGHSGCLVKIVQATLLIDPLLTGIPMVCGHKLSSGAARPGARKASASAKAAPSISAAHRLRR